MDERWPRVKALFQSAAARPSGERDAFLAAATGDDEALRREVESLLTWDAADGSVLDRLPPASMDPTPSHPVLAAGLRVGPYEIVAALGAGGMGEVYRARDTKLRRDVAIKVLPESFANDPDRLARFQREAQVLASLNHPNIGGIHGLEESGSVRALVMELVEGEDLSQRIARGPIPDRRGLADRETNRRGAGGSARARGHPPRSQAPEHQSPLRWHREGARLRPGENDGTAVVSGRGARPLAEDHEPGRTKWRWPNPGHGRLHEPRAGAWQVAGQTDGYLVVRVRALRNAHGPCAVRRQYHLRHARRDSRARAGPNPAAGRRARTDSQITAPVSGKGS